MPAALAAAHVGHLIEHSSAFMGFLIGAAVGLAAAVAIVAIVGTGGAALAVVAAVGGVVAATGGGALTGMAIGETIKNPKGPISTGSPNVFYGPARIPAARAVIDSVACTDHGPKFLATGSDSVFVNVFPAVRDDDKTECDGTVFSDLSHILIGAETVQYLEIDSEVPDWMVNVAMGMVIVGTAVALTFGAAAAFTAAGLCGLINFAGSVVGGMVGAAILAPVGGMIGEALGGETGKRIGEAVGGFVGGLVGGGLGRRMTTGHPIDVATGELHTSGIEFFIGGLIEIPWERFWMSSSTQDGPLGSKWHHPFDMVLAEGGGSTILRVEHGRLILLPLLAVGQSFWHRAEQLLASREAPDRWRIRRNDGLDYVLAGDGGTLRLEAIEDRNGNRIALEHDERGCLVRAIATDGVQYLFTSDAQGRLVGVAKTDGHRRVELAAYRYDPAGDLVAATDAAGGTIGYEYDRHLMVKEVLRGGFSYYFQWDDPSLGVAARCVATWGDGDLYRRHLDYRPDERTTIVTTGQGAREVFAYDRIGLVTQVTRPLGQVSVLEYNRFAEPQTITDALGGVVQWKQDAFGRVIEMTDQSGARSGFAYVTDNPLSPNFLSIAVETDALGNETANEYDTRGNLVATTDALGNRTRFLRDPRGLTLNIQDELGTVARFFWTPEGRLREERTAKGGRIQRVHDGFGLLLSETVEGIEPTHFEYDTAERVIRVRHPNHTATTLGYDADGNIVAMTAPSGNTTRWHHGGFPAPVLRINPDGSRFAYRYDAELGLVELVNEVGDRYRLEYDLNQRLVAETGFDGRRQTYAYDDADHVVAIEDGHRRHRFQRDAMGRLLRRDSSDGDWASYAYDPLGRMLRADNPARQVGYRHDALGQVIAETQDEAELSHLYSPRGQRVTTMLPDGRLLRFGYDRNGDFDRIGLGEREVLHLDRDRLGRVRRKQAGAITQVTDYDPQGRIARQTAWRGAMVNPVFARSYGYDSVGRLTLISDITRGEARFQFDERSRLRRALTAEGMESFDFDPADTILAGVSGPRDASVQGGRVLMQGDRHYEYDDAGNRVVMRRGQGGAHVFRYVYDDMNNLVAVHEVRGRVRRSTHFTYDALTRRVSKSHRETTEAANNAPRAGSRPPELVREEVTRFLWNGDVLLAEGRAGSDPLAVVYVYEPESFRPAAQIRRHSPEAEGEVLLYWLDHIGTPLELSNENGALVWQVALKAWGGVARVYHDRVAQNLRFQGQYHDEETGLHYSRFRHYDPDAGSFVSPDPIALLGGERPFAYPVNPLAGIDPLGLIDPGDTNGGKGYTVYRIVDKQTGKVVYVGQTESDRYDVRRQEHARSGRLHDGVRMERITRTKTYGQARGAEQYHILNSNDGKGTLQTDARGKPLGPGTEGNRARSYDPARLEGDKSSSSYKRAKAFENGYEAEKRRVTTTGKAC